MTSHPSKNGRFGTLENPPNYPCQKPRSKPRWLLKVFDNRTITDIRGGAEYQQFGLIAAIRRDRHEGQLYQHHPLPLQRRWVSPTLRARSKRKPRKMTTPKIAQKSPIRASVEEGKSYFWCSCGQSANQPFCDGSHKGTDFTPVKWEAPETKDVFFCACKHSADPVLCDGSHSKL